MRHQLAVSSPLAFGALAAGAAAALGRRRGDRDALGRALRERFRARAVSLTDSGTSALVLALRLTAGAGGTVALPGYACVDLVAAARAAAVKVRLYDVDPATLSPDLDSVAATLRRGVDVVVVAHLYGYPADLPGVIALADAHGVPVIEDAAQGAGGLLAREPLGSLGALSVLSFGRGKGVTGGRGGALLATTEAMRPRVEATAPAPAGAGPGWRELGLAGAQWLFGRPWLYGIPASVPALGLGEMVYRPAGEPGPLPAAAATLALRALGATPGDLVRRRSNAHRLLARAQRAPGVRPVRAVEGGEPGYLRLAVHAPDRGEAPRLGIMRGYPRTLFEMPELAPVLCAGEGDHPGAVELRRALLTLPTHAMVTHRDVEAIGAWLGARPPSPPYGAVAVSSEGPRITARQ
jgi:hypothetical protein